jgi:hypothetical protein
MYDDILLKSYLKYLNAVSEQHIKSRKSFVLPVSLLKLIDDI